MNKTILYYDENAEFYTESTVYADLRETQNRFLKKLKTGADILDFGCGSGRDTKFFLEQGYHVSAIDGSKKLCEIAGKYTGITVRHMLFQQLCDVEAYDGIWACSSILHLTGAELTDVLDRMQKALRNGGIIYTSFKYGTFEGERNDRFFSDFTEESFQKRLDGFENLKIEEQWKTGDVRPGREKEQWLNVILRKSK